MIIDTIYSIVSSKYLIMKFAHLYSIVARKNSFDKGDYSKSPGFYLSSNFTIKFS
jgi:hypothetical protein